MIKLPALSTCCLLLFPTLLPAYALPGSGYASRGTREGLEHIVKAASVETTESGAQAAARRAAERIGRTVPEAEALLRQYGDALWIILRNERRARLYGELGEDAAQAFIRHGDAAESILAHLPTPEMARGIASLDHTSVRYLDALVQRGQVSAADSEDWLRLIRERGHEVLEYAWKHPRLTAATLLAGGAGAYALAEPESTRQAADGIRELLDFTCEHPVRAAAIALLTGAACIQGVKWLKQAPGSAVRWVGRKLFDKIAG